MQNTSSQDNKPLDKQIVEEIYSRIRHTINPIDAADRVLVAIIKALIAFNNEPSSPRQLAGCIQEYNFTQLGGQTPYATVSGHISTHFSRVRQQIIPGPIIGKQPHPTITKRSLYYFLDPENVLRDLLAEHFPYTSQPITPTPSESSTSEDPYDSDIPLTPSSSSVTNFKERKNDIMDQDDEHISDAENHHPDQKKFSLDPQAKNRMVDPVVTPHDVTGNTKGEKKRSYDAWGNVITQPSPPNYSHLNYLNYLSTIPSRNPGSPRAPLAPDIHIMKLNGLEVFTTRAKNGVTLLRRVDNGCVDKYSLLQAGGQRARNSDRKWITLEQAKTLGLELNIEESLGIFLYERLFDYFDIDLDHVITTNGCCPLGFAYFFQCVSPKKTFLE